ncbi:MAG: NAD-dependent epimerase/dehydratase family protein [Deltaproteobacteria bacterium]|nr:NAD-dependent epimerase/dehydratase family protein [Deltaproteobacteria bacterium]
MSKIKSLQVTDNMPRKVIVTGGGGFVGKALCKRLIQLGFEVLSLSRGDYPELRKIGIKTVQADVSSPLDKDLFDDVEAVFHTASKVDMWGRYQDFYQINVLGTQNIIDACLAAGVDKLIYTSSPSVIADGKDHRGIDESYPYPKKHAAFYPETKAEAERRVLAANSEKFKTIALRPHLIFGPGDTGLGPTVIERAQAGKLIIIGPGKNLVDFTYIDDCVEAHLNAYQALSEKPEVVSGKAYFVSQGEPTKMWEWINKVLSLNGLSPVKKSVPYSIAMLLSSAIEFFSKVMPLKLKPTLTPFLVSQMSCDHYFSIERAKRDLGYKPTISIDEGLEKTYKAA